MLANLIMGLELLLIYLIKYGLFLIPLYFVVKFAMIAALRTVREEYAAELYDHPGPTGDENDGSML